MRRFFMFNPMILIIVLLTFQSANAETHIRFWRGFKQDTSTAIDFKKNVASQLVPATISVGKNKGLVSYMPVFLTAETSKPEFLPDEVAIIQYQDEPTYKTLAMTPEFSAYGKMHFEAGFFTKKNNSGFSSGSMVSKTITEGTPFDVSKAFAINYGDVDSTWKNDLVQLRVIFLKDSTNEKANCLQSIVTSLQENIHNNSLKGFILAFDPMYLLIYEKSNFKKVTPFKLDMSTDCSSENVIQLKNQHGFDDQSEGVNVSF